MHTAPSHLLAPVEASRPSLTAEEHIRLAQLTRIVEINLNSFLAAGRALAEIKSSRLYRERFETFEDFAKTVFGLCRSTADHLVRSTATAELLMANGVALPPGTQEAVVRPVSSLPSAELQVEAWRLVQAVSPERGASEPIASKVVRTIRNAIDSDETTGNGHKPRSQSFSERETPFIRPVTRLVKWSGFDAGMVTSHVEKLPSAWTTYEICGKMIERCEAVRSVLAQRFPELCQPTP